MRRELVLLVRSMPAPAHANERLESLLDVRIRTSGGRDARVACVPMQQRGALSSFSDLVHTPPLAQPERVEHSRSST